VVGTLAVVAAEDLTAFFAFEAIGLVVGDGLVLGVLGGGGGWLAFLAPLLGAYGAWLWGLGLGLEGGVRGLVGIGGLHRRVFKWIILAHE
jgi:hypothetical protein